MTEKRIPNRISLVAGLAFVALGIVFLATPFFGGNAANAGVAIIWFALGFGFLVVGFKRSSNQ